MISEELKNRALSQAIEIAKEHAKSGYKAPESTISNAYKEIIKIIEEIESSEN